MRLIPALRLQTREVVALVGAGGKSALLFRLADELAAAGRHVVTTMTTKIFVAQKARAPVTLAIASDGEREASNDKRQTADGERRASDIEGEQVVQDEDALLARLPELLARHQHVLVTGGTIVEEVKIQGVAPRLVDRLAGHEAVDVVIVEADGSRRKPLKAPAAHEPVIPSTATLVVPVVGLDVVGRPLTADHVHRPEIIAALTGTAPGAPVTP
ncbi:MAG: selenium cofactor biosynthesis protein YqeC, partial [Anaerolineae bacterium]|nr:selenium cofactor biosynthesis protein YqeC [Anaerolineae bacterium]